MNTDEGLRAALNTDRELWRAKEGDFYSDSIHVTAQGAIGINCGGTVIVKPLREWLYLAAHPSSADDARLAEAERIVEAVMIVSANAPEKYSGPLFDAAKLYFKNHPHPSQPTPIDDARLAEAEKVVDLVVEHEFALTVARAYRAKYPRPDQPPTPEASVDAREARARLQNAICELAFKRYDSPIVTKLMAAIDDYLADVRSEKE